MIKKGKKKPSRHYDTHLSLLAEGDDIYVKVGWEDGNIEQISNFLLSIVDGTAFPIFLQHAEQFALNNNDMESFEKIKNNLGAAIERQKNESETMIQPINAINHLATMHQGAPM